MRELAINYGSTEQLINNLFNILNNLDIEKSNVKRALNELYDLENYYSNKGEIISELEYRERKINNDIRDTEDLIKSLQSFSRSVQETDERLAQKFKQDVKSYSKKNNIELVSELDKFLNKAEMTLDALGLVPGIGEVADGINGILSLLRGNWGNALISFGSMIPVAGDSLKGLKYLDKASDLLKMGDKVVDLEKGGKKLSKVADKLDDLKIKDIDFNILNTDVVSDIALKSSDSVIANLKNTQNFKDGALEHILEGEINKRGKAVGFHYEGLPSKKGIVLEGTKTIPNEFGVYTGNVKINGVPKVSNGGKSTFFPENWSAQEVVDAINEAFDNKKFVQGTMNTYRGKSLNGVKIEMYIENKTNKIISAFPKE